MKTREAFEVMAPKFQNAVAVCALGVAANEWWAVTRSEETFYTHGSMGFAASFALGLALSLPSTPVWMINADGSLCMNLGCLLTEAAQQASNLKHFVVDNRVYQTVGGTPMVNHQNTDYAGLARAAGFKNTWSLKSTDEVAQALPEILAARGPAFAVLQVESEPAYGAKYAGTYEGPEMKYRFGRTLERKLGITVFGPQGY
jgi:sulfopyruvate decarboxylase subunit beta